MDLNQLSSFLAAMIALSIGVERIVEVLKSFLPWLRDDPSPQADPTGNKAAHRRGVLQLLATLVGAVVAYAIGPHSFLNALPADASQSVLCVGSVFLGFMSSGGSGLWNHLLDIVGAVKSVKEKVASHPAAANQARVAPP
jgi:hypothetical protein